MKELYIARQPVFGCEGNKFANELLYRDSKENICCQENHDKASSEFLAGNFLDIGLDILVGGKKVFVNFTGQLLRKTWLPCSRRIRLS